MIKIAVSKSNLNEASLNLLFRMRVVQTSFLGSLSLSLN